MELSDQLLQKGTVYCARFCARIARCATILDMADVKDKFYIVYNNLPLGVREEVVLVLNGEPISWKVAKLEADNNTNLSIEILEKLKYLNFI